MIDNRDIAVVVQGPVENNYQGRKHHEEGITQRGWNVVDSRNEIKLRSDNFSHP